MRHPQIGALEVVLPGPKDSSCLEYDTSKPVREWFCRGELEYIRDARGHYGTRCLKCSHVRPFQDNEPDTCPSCKADFRAGAWEVPQLDWHLFGARKGTRRIGIYDMNRDRTAAWRCPDCKHEWAR